MTADQIIAAARSCLGTPFRHQGMRRGQGLDCAGLAIQVARDCGLSPQVVQGYGRYPAPGQLRAAIEAQDDLVEVAKDRACAGDLLLMRWGDHPQHLAICAGETIIHAHEPSGKVVEHLMPNHWRAAIVAVYRFRNVA